MNKNEILDYMMERDYISQENGLFVLGEHREFLLIITERNQRNVFEVLRARIISGLNLGEDIEPRDIVRISLEPIRLGNLIL